MHTQVVGGTRWLMSRGALSVWLIAAVAGALPVGCGGDDGDDDTAGAGGTSPQGGASGKSGNGGDSAKSGSSGKGGSTGGTGADGGTSGSGAKGGKGGKGGTAGTGGTNAGGTTGSAGAGEGGMPSTGGTAGDAGSGGGGGEPGGSGGSSGDDSGGAGAGPISCESQVEFSADEKTAIAALGPLGSVPADSTNAFADNAAAATLGQKLFFDKAFSGALTTDSDLGTTGQTGKVSCASCHATDSLTLIDNRSDPPSTSIGTGFHTKNAPGMVNSSFYDWTNWGGRFSRQWELPTVVAESGLIMNSTRLQVAHVIYSKYKTEYDAVFTSYPLDDSIATMPATGKPGDGSNNWENLTDGQKTIVMRVFVNYSKALAAYTRKLVSKNSPFDAYVAGDDCAISEEAKKGLKLFVGAAGCVSCHSGSLMSDNAFHNLGVPQTGASPWFDHVPATDDGRFKGITDLKAAALNASNATYSDDPTAGATKINALDATNAANHAAFRTPSLRSVSTSGPYMHSGQLETLEDVIDFYDAGGGDVQAGSTKDAMIVPLGLTSEQKANLKTFLETLRGAQIPEALLEDTSN